MVRWPGAWTSWVDPQFTYSRAETPRFRPCTMDPTIRNAGLQKGRIRTKARIPDVSALMFRTHRLVSMTVVSTRRDVGRAER